MLFHPEADFALVEAWLVVPEMIDDGGRGARRRREPHELPERAAALEPTLIERTAPGFDAFAEIVAGNG